MILPSVKVVFWILKDEICSFKYAKIALKKAKKKVNNKKEDADFGKRFYCFLKGF